MSPSGWTILNGARPKLVPTLIALPGVILLLALGSWQVARHFEIAAENERRAMQSTMPPITLAAAKADPQAMRFRRVRVEGRFDHARELYVYARSRNGNEGFYVLTPLIGEAGKLLVNRGWVPPERRDPTSRATGQLVGLVGVTGVLRDEARHGMFVPDNDEAKNRWFWFDLPAMNRAAGIADAAAVYLEADNALNPGGFPIGGQTQLRLPTPHVQYAITWYSLAIGLGVVFIVYHRRLGSP